MPEPSILIVHADRKAQRTVQRILGVTGYRVAIADGLDQGIRLMQHAAPLLIVVDETAAASPHAEAFFAEAQALGAETCMTLLGGTGTAAVPHVLELGAVTSLLVHPMPVLAEELMITALKLIRGDLFGAEKYLLAGTELHETWLVRASQRAAIVEQLAESVRARGQSARVASMAMLVADELLSNAVHNAPVDASGVHYRRDLSRGGEIELDDRHRVRLRWGCDARYLAIEVRDQFGSLDRGTILRALARGARDAHDESSAREPRTSGGGAGLGMSLSYQACDYLVFDLAPGRCTEVIGLIDVRYPAAERVAASSYSVFVERT